MAKLNWQIVSLILGVLVAIVVLSVYGVIPSSVASALLTGIAGWLAPSPLSTGGAK